MTREEAIMCIKHEILLTVNRKDLTGQAIGEALDMAIEALEQEPVVRCKDCIHALTEPLADGRQFVFCRRYRKERVTEGDGYCGYGEREEE